MRTRSTFGGWWTASESPRNVRAIPAGNFYSLVVSENSSIHIFKPPHDNSNAGFHPGACGS
jgi:hypothetical protein